MSEDCLYLHITTGAQSEKEKRPVFMWFHGGGLTTGYYSEIEYDPSELARKGVVVTSVRQRLNAFGYLCLPQLSAEQGDTSGNYGLKDEVKALEWVRENIAAFDGDPDNITVGGQSGGNVVENSLWSNGPMSGANFEMAKEFYLFMREKRGDLYDKYDFEKIWQVTDDNLNYISRVLASRAFSRGYINTGDVITNRYFGAYRAKNAPKAHNYACAFGHYTPSLPEEKGTFRDMNNLLAWHSSELWYTFASLRENVPVCRAWTEVDFRLADVVSSYWANFIKTGNPNGQDSSGNQLPYWPESRENYGWMLFTDEAEGHEGIDELDKLALEYIKREGIYPEI